MYFLYGEENFLINKKIKQICKKYPKHKIMHFYYENIDKINNFIKNIYTDSLFNEKKILIMHNFEFFTKKNIDKKEIFILEQLIDSLNFNDENIIVFVNNEISESKNIFSNFFTENTIKKLDKSNIYEFKKLNNKEKINLAIEYVKEKEGYLSFVDASILVNILEDDTTLLISELDKLLSYDKKITSDMIYKIIAPIIKDDPFGFVNSLETNSLEFIWKKYKEKIEQGEYIINLISQLSQTLIICNQIHNYLKVNDNLLAYCSDFKINNYRAKKIQNLISKLGIYKIKNMLKNLAVIEEDIKNGKINEKIAFEQLLIRYFQ
ncbi:DNA polymerase III subunit delta [Mycoplasmopsis meleagridis]|uniref:DNA polymerase III subunit delta n=1 Tax=Mycoplasmopsis meleagridis TaxID=29561 RepID=UPI003A866F99